MQQNVRGRMAHRRKGVAAIFAMVLLVVLIGFASLTLDVGAMYNTRADLQNAADAAALAAAAAYTSPEMTQIRLGAGSDGQIQDVIASGRAMAQEAGLKNWSFGSDGTEIPDEDITFGWIDLASGTSAIDTSASPATFNAVQVVTRRSAQVNGPLQFFFASIFGKSTTTITASAVASYVGTITAYDIAVPFAANLWPFTIHEDEFDKWALQGADNYSYDSEKEMVFKGNDGEREVRLYPDKLAPGNYGLLNIGAPSQSTNMLETQIVNGVMPADLEMEVGTSQLAFSDENGNPTGYDISGNPGLKSALQASIVLRYGDIVAFFVHDHVQKSGSNVSYHVTGIRFARVMFSALSGPNRGIQMQPVAYTGPGVIMLPGPASSSTGQIVLAR
jgi:hypothetical protein